MVASKGSPPASQVLLSRFAPKSLACVCFSADATDPLCQPLGLPAAGDLLGCPGEPALQLHPGAGQTFSSEGRVTVRIRVWACERGSLRSCLPSHLARPLRAHAFPRITGGRHRVLHLLGPRQLGRLEDQVRRRQPPLCAHRKSRTSLSRRPRSSNDHGAGQSGKDGQGMKKSDMLVGPCPSAPRSFREQMCSYSCFLAPVSRYLRSWTMG